MEQLSNAENHDVEIGRINVVTWMDCLDLRMLAVLANSTLSSSRLDSERNGYLSSESVLDKLIKQVLQGVQLKACELKLILLIDLYNCSASVSHGREVMLVHIEYYDRSDYWKVK
ncbi:uncharacterized protein LOC114578788 [Dendrobium catenatum]|uniref:uncharacterized protein LOC114578788 n=1 Tax=Dendrobium catenatum TaxID=906689 RepID=UPI00109EE588|nr:uncharacterized protein LOC114578788 [Dendrobium catenatum]